LPNEVAGNKLLVLLALSGLPRVSRRAEAVNVEVSRTSVREVPKKR